MITSTLLVAAVLSSQASGDRAADFFPLNPGDEYTYTDEAGRQRWTIVDRVGGPVTVGGRDAFRVDSYLGDKVFGSAFYYIDDKEVVVAAYEKDKPMASPLPIFRIPGSVNTWEFEGVTTIISDDVNTRLTGSVKRAKAFRYMGKERETLEVKLTVTDGTVITEQTSLYARGIGLVEMREVTTMNKTKQNRLRRLLSYRPAAAKGS